MTNATYCVWMRLPVVGTKSPWTRVAGELSQEHAEWLARTLYFEARAMPDQPKDNER